MNEFVKYLKVYHRYLTKHQIDTLKGQALSGNLLAARKGLVRILNRNGCNVELGRW